jgi:hypothetical protein
MVTALVANASDEIKYRVGIKLAAASAAFMEKYAGMPPEVQKLIVTLEPRFDEIDEAATECPACGSQGVARGKYSVAEEVDYDKDRRAVGLGHGEIHAKRLFLSVVRTALGYPSRTRRSQSARRVGRS